MPGHHSGGIRGLVAVARACVVSTAPRGRGVARVALFGVADQLHVRATCDFRIGSRTGDRRGTFPISWAGVQLLVCEARSDMDIELQRGHAQLPASRIAAAARAIPIIL